MTCLSLGSPHLEHRNQWLEGSHLLSSANSGALDVLLLDRFSSFLRFHHARSHRIFFAGLAEFAEGCISFLLNHIQMVSIHFQKRTHFHNDPSSLLDRLRTNLLGPCNRFLFCTSVFYAPYPTSILSSLDRLDHRKALQSAKTQYRVCA